MKAPTPETARRLRALLDRHSRGEKHIGYHILPERLNALLAGSGLENRYTFHEPPRMAFFRRQVDFRGRSVLDIGCNIGWFLVGALDAGASRVVGWEGKPSCAGFLAQAIRELGEQDRFELHAGYYRFDDGPDGQAGGAAAPHFDVALLLNVLHHLGDDYGNPGLGIAAAREGMLRQLNGLARQADTLLFQLGFNWKGNRQLGLFEHGTKAEMIEFVTQGTQGHWAVQAIGIAERDATTGAVHYAAPSAANLPRQDELGEFLNRPLFVLRSRHAG